MSMGDSRTIYIGSLRSKTPRQLADKGRVMLQVFTSGSVISLTVDINGRCFFETTADALPADILCTWITSRRNAHAIAEDVAIELAEHIRAEGKAA